jgi:hypothetical protein
MFIILSCILLLILICWNRDNFTDNINDTRVRYFDSIQWASNKRKD